MSKELPFELSISLAGFKDLERAEISAAYLFAAKKHKGQKRKSGQNYVSHPVKVASYLARNSYDKDSIIAALLHDTMEDTKTTYDEIETKFGKDVADIVEGVTKISSIKIKNKAEIFSDDELFLAKVDNYRKILLASISDLRVIIIKLYDRLHNIETIEYLPKNKQKFYARETIGIFAPIAERLGMSVLKGRLEDLSFPYAFPDEYQDFIKIAESAYKNPQEIIEQMIPKVEEILKKSNIRYSVVSGRTKHRYSLYKKLEEKKDIALIFDIVALRIIVETVEECYKTLGTIHSIFQPLPGRIFDYIARPKKSGYQSLHTTARDDQGHVFEIQIRTDKMHQHAEYGPAAHWNYKEEGSSKKATQWLRELQKIDLTQNNRDLINTIKEEFFSHQIFVYTPKGEIIDLPSGSTPLDFAYRVHSDVGDHCKGVKINGRLKTLDTVLITEDIVEILTDKKSRPRRDWLEIAKTTGAKTKIRNYLREIGELI